MLAAGQMSRLSVGTGVAPADASVRAIVQQFTLHHPDLTVLFEIIHRRALVERLELRKIEIAIAALTSMRPGAHIRTGRLWRLAGRTLRR